MASRPNDKKLKEAEGEEREALELMPGLAIARVDLGKILIRQERDSEGIVEDLFEPTEEGGYHIY
jgi:hypothetical protein